jgi:hypothetical protein
MSKFGTPLMWTQIVLPVALAIVVSTQPTAGGAIDRLELARGSYPADRPETLLSSSAAAIRLTSQGLNLSGSVSPSAVCVLNDSSCDVGGTTADVTLSAVASGSGTPAWTAVQVLFVMETTSFDGVADYYPAVSIDTFDRCVDRGELEHEPISLCGESNSVPFFVTNAGAIATAIQAAHPLSNVSFGLVDYFHTDDRWDTYGGNSSEYHVDVGKFVPASRFQSEVDASIMDGILNSSFELSGSNVTTNFLDSSSITSLYGSLMGAGLSWANSSHHVIVWMGSSAPRDPSYVVNYCVAPISTPFLAQYWIHDNSSLCQSNDTNVTSPTCEPAYSFSPSLVSPACVGWIQPETGPGGQSIAELSRTAPACAMSLGGNCTIDTIDYWAMPTDPSSQSWSAYFDGPSGNGSTAGSWWAKEDAKRIIDAACDLANATGGTWDGPSISSCGPGQNGSLLFSPLGPYTDPLTVNPSLLSALTDIGLGRPTTRVSLVGDSGPLFTFVPWGNVRPVTGALIRTSCGSEVRVPTGCESQPRLVSINGIPELTWNWSSLSTENYMFVGDVWSTTFLIEVVGPPKNAVVPVDGCTLPPCLAVEQPVTGYPSTEAQFAQPGTANSTQLSFPLVEIFVGGDPLPPTQTVPPPPPTLGGPPPSPTLSPSPFPTVGITPILVATPSPGVSLMAGFLGFLAAGFSRIAVRSDAVAVRTASMAGPRSQRRLVRSNFDEAAQMENSGLSRLE